MRTVDMHEAKIHLSRLVEGAARGEPFVIARAGKPLVKVLAVDAPEAGPAGRTGFLAGRISLPDNFDRMGSTEIETLFEGGASDPFDRLLMAQAQIEAMTLLTMDEVVARYPGPIQLVGRP